MEKVRISRGIDELDEVEYGDSIPDWGEERGAIRTEQEVSLTVHGSKQVGKLGGIVSAM